MTVIDLKRGAPVSSPEAPLSIALGSFDGVHAGHRALIARVLDRTGTVSAVWTFARNPFGVPALTPLDCKLAILTELGVRYALVCEFDEVRGQGPAEFVDGLARLGAARLVCGCNYTFGANRSADAGELARLCAERGLDCEIASPVRDARGEMISSTRIRELLAAGKIEEANALLGRRWSLTAPVAHGSGIGHKLGYPTLNQRLPEGLALPARGVYATLCEGAPSMTDVGVRPTVADGGEPVCETHVFGASGDLYGMTMKVEFLRYLRPERKFGSLDELKAQLGYDAAAALQIHGLAPTGPMN